MSNKELRELPAVHEVLNSLGGMPFPHAVLVSEVRGAIERAREELRNGAGEWNGIVGRITEDARLAIESLKKASLRKVINATGVVLHTNLGRAPIAAMRQVEGYSNLEYDLETGRRGQRDAHAGALIERILGVPGILVNNNAAAVYLALNELARGGEVLVSRGELIEIGDGFRIPDIMACSGAALREVGTTNRTRIEDYASAITEHTRLILVVHPSNFRIEGFTAKPARRAIAELGRRARVPVYEDLGSGCLADLREYGISEPRPQEALADGVSLVSFSGDKLMGGPQSGILAGEADLVSRLRRNPMYRALRVDKLTCAAVEDVLRHTLLEEWDAIPALRLVRLPVDRINVRAEELVEGLPGAQLIAGESVIGGGSTPGQSIPTWLIAIHCDAAKTDAKLRRREIPVIARIESGCLIVDLRTVAEDDEPELRAALRAALAA